jgi:hypothetical protein
MHRIGALGPIGLQRRGFAEFLDAVTTVKILRDIL